MNFSGRSTTEPLLPLELLLKPNITMNTPTLPPEPSTQGFVFHATGREFFKIWIVNLALTIVTLGIYAAWAKVRTRKYLYQSTELNQQRFDYHGDPKAILKGNLLVAGVFLAYFITLSFASALSGLIILAVLCLMPWVLVSSLRFHLANSSHCHLRFRFDGKASTAYKELGIAFATILGVFLMIGIVVSITGALSILDMEAETSWLGILLSVVATLVGLAFIVSTFHTRLRLFVMNHSRFGNAEFGCTIKTDSVCKLLLKAWLVCSLLMMAIGIAVGALGASFMGGLGALASGEGLPQGDELGAAMMIGVMTFMGVFYFLLFGVGVYVKTALDNLAWNLTTLEGGHRFESTASPLKASGIFLSNLILIVFTAGLFTPFAKVRMIRYRLRHTAFKPNGTTQAIVQAQQHTQKAYGDSVGDALGMEVAL